MNSVENTIQQAIASKNAVIVTTKKWKDRTVIPHSIQNGELHCDVVLVSLLGDCAHKNAAIKLADITKAVVTAI